MNRYIFGNCSLVIFDAGKQKGPFLFPSSLGSVRKRLRGFQPLGKLFFIGGQNAFKIRTCNGNLNISLAVFLFFSWDLIVKRSAHLFTDGCCKGMIIGIIGIHKLVKGQIDDQLLTVKVFNGSKMGIYDL